MRGHRYPALSAGLFLLTLVTVFFPVLFFGRVISPLDTVANDPPWKAVHPPVEVANPDLEEAATAVLPLQLMARRTGFSTAIWNPHLACGGPGWLCWSAGVLSPTVALVLPWVPLEHLVTAEVFLRLLIAFSGMWLLLRRRNLSEAAAAIGGLVYALSLPLAANWLWPVSGSAAFLPLLLWALDRAASRESSIAVGGSLVGIVWLLFMVGGAPGLTLTGGYLAAAWFVWRLRAELHDAGKVLGRMGSVALGVAAGTAVLGPALALWWRSAAGWGALDPISTRPGLGFGALRLLISPFIYGDPRHGTFTPPAGLEGVGFHEMSLAVGSIAVALAVLGAFHRRDERSFWVPVVLVILGALAFGPAAAVLSILPGLNHVDPLRLGPLLVLGLAYLSATGWEALENLGPARLRSIAALAVGLAVILQQGLLVGHLTTFLEPGAAKLEATESIAWLRKHTQPGNRVAPLFEALPPDTAASLDMLDVRSRFASLSSYRSLIRAVDPQSWDETGRRIVLNGATIDLTHPYLAALGARWVLEPPEMHLVEYGLVEHTLDLGPRSGQLGPLKAGLHLSQELVLPAGTSRLAVNLEGDEGSSAQIEAVLHADGRILGTWTVTVSPDRGGPLAWIDLPPAVSKGPVTLELTCRAVTGAVYLWKVPELSGPWNVLRVNGEDVRGALALSFDTSGYVLAHEGSDLRIWENRRAFPLFWVVHRAVPGSLKTMLEAIPPLDLSRQAIVPTETAGVLPGQAKLHGTERVHFVTDSAARFKVDVELESPGLLVSSLPLDPPIWRMEVDGRNKAPLRVNGLFLGTRLEPGRHSVRIHPALPVAPWILSLIGCTVLAVLAIPWSRSRRSLQ